MWSHGFMAGAAVAAAALAGAIATQRTREARRLSRALREQEDHYRLFVASLGHEIRTPLTGIQGYLELLEDEASGDTWLEREGYLEGLRRNVDHLIALSSDLMAPYRLKTAPSATTPLPLMPQLEGVIFALSAEANSRGVTIALVAPADVPPVLADELAIRQVLYNLLFNAIKASSAGGKITIEAGTEPKHGRVKIAIRDRGSGIPEERQSRLFEAGYRGPGSEGSGLGLWIAQRLLKDLGGTLQLESAPGEGSCFSFLLAQAPEERKQQSPPLERA